MGGWRCSYRNCTMRGDGKTHMFHYPVFDKVRCHQWLVNAGRLDFLNLKVSQLKNRVICQHHFTKENFMNFKKDKLIFDAVPTLDGPFCEVSEGQSKSIDETTSSLSIMLDDIENEYMTLNDKKANYSVKYADFLTSNELADIDISTFVPQHNVYNKSKNCEIELPVHKNNDSKTYNCNTPETFESKDFKTTFDVFVHKKEPNVSMDTTENYSKASTPEISKKYQKQPVQVVPPYKTKCNQNQSLIEENVLEIQLPPGFINNNALLTDDSKGNISYQTSGNFDGREVVSFTPKLLNKKNNAKVKILSEERICEPLTFTGHLEPVSPSSVLPILQKKPTVTSQKVSNEIEHLEPVRPMSVLEQKPADIPQNTSNVVILNNQELLLCNVPPEPVQTIAANNVKKKVVKEYKVNQAKSPRTSLLKNKITPERVAAIEEKRKFNMKLRDIIETFLDKLDEQDKEIKDSECRVSTQQSLHEKKSLNIAEQTIANLEARIKKMEDALLNKIDQNSQKIIELKNTIVHQNQTKKKSSATQTSMESECQKKRLFQEISQYLSADANSLIYEELFINKFVKDVPKASSAKRKRRR